MNETEGNIVNETADTRVVPYSGELPVPEKVIRAWWDNDVTLVRIVFPSTVNDLTYYYGMDEMNDMMDETVGVMLVDLTYGVDKEATRRNWEENPADDNDTVYLFVEAEIDWSSYDYDEE